MLSVLLATALTAGSAYAWGRERIGVGFYFGMPIAAFPYYYYPPYYAAPIVVQQPAPVYVERNPQPAAQVQESTAGVWYYCAETRGYYPYTKECPSGWQRVAPQPR
jgi:hypothetical protein